MKRFFIVPLFLCGTFSFAQAQEITSATLSSTNVAADFAVTSGARVPLVKPLSQDGPLFIADTFEPAASGTLPVVATALAVPEPALAPLPEPAAKPAKLPSFRYSSRDDYRWELALGGAMMRFRSSVYRALAVGTNTSLTYFLNDWLGVEGNLSTFFAPTIYQNEHIKLVEFVGGPKITWRQPHYEPFAHILVGGMHAIPQTASGGKTGFAMQVGGGVDLRLFPRFSVRGEANYAPTKMFGEWQHNLEASLSGVLHF
jgi:hypothetical protein